ncbi:hypothetical protein SMACR_07791 [Sordaria macrospora]|uniref:C2H2-type domain-containing protein n=1 Tax=Sordaria macrospora TaxID=5147 RepID=A0A8S8ZNH1_SORMA|nr:hypothetical protein SMACR_07791 [Sordaria macrospora]KAH7635641.1 hypothetical protein B0T09DRAFT_25645 [Sordaria sp. MPI-SDFR-AT-0083]WPJ64140.1 hypothetical protein SMAC4_07791 [Sordaria macrospora]
MVTYALSMCDLFLDLDHHDAGFLDYPPSSFSGASSSYSFASNGPFTPSSGSSTPARHNSMDFGSSFAPPVDNVFTPPPSSVSAYFPLNMKAGDGSDFLATGMPLTPSRNQLNNVQPMYYNDVGTHLTSPQQMDYYTFHNGLALSPLAPSPAAQAIQPGNTYDAWSVWEQAESPIFAKFLSPSSNSCRSASRVKQEEEMSPMSAGEHSYPSPAGKRQLYVKEARQKTTALQMVQRDAPLAPRPSMHMGGEVKHEQGAYGPGSILIDPIQRVSAGTNVCDYPGCGKTYRRSEHLKRHKKNAHSEVPIWYPCSFCDKKFNRPDNRRQHLGLHAKPRPTKMKGVKYAPKAKAALEEELKHIPRRNKKPKAEHHV